MIENEKQYNISKRKLAELKILINKVEQDTEHDPIRNQLILVSLCSSKDHLENEISRYLSRKLGNTRSY
jgi:hypothetical protein